MTEKLSFTRGVRGVGLGAVDVRRSPKVVMVVLMGIHIDDLLLVVMLRVFIWKMLLLHRQIF